MKLIYLKSALKCNSFDATIGIKILFFRVLVTIELGCSLLHSLLPQTVWFINGNEWTEIKLKEVASET